MGVSYLENVSVSSAPNFIKAKSPRGLRLAMLRNNLRLKAFIKYFDIQFVSGNWYAWYFEPETLSTDFQGVTNGE